jgi:hypothetical protein
MAGSQQVMSLMVKGLYTNPSQYGANVPEGAVNVANNIVLDRESYAQTRRGFHRYGTSLGVGNSVKEILQFANDMIVHTDNGNLYYDSDQKGTWVQYPGTYSSPSTDQGSRIRAGQSNSNFYFLTSNGAYKLDTLTSTPVKAGAPKGLGGEGVITGTTGFMSANSNVAYRIVWGYIDANNNEILGAPSERIIVSNNTANTVNVTLTFQIPNGVTTNWFFQVYRSFESVDLATPPNDELQQCFEGNPTADQLNGELITITDATPDDLLQTLLYTNPSQQTIDQANWQPPFAQDITVYKGYTFYSNTRTVHRLNLTLVSSEPPLGLQIGDTITFTDNSTGHSFTLTGANIENQVTGNFQIFNTGDPALDIQDTAQSIVKILNLNSNAQWLNAYYMSDFNQLPGQMLFEKVDLTPETFFVTSSRSTAWSFPVPATGSNNRTTSQNDNLPNRIYYSKFDQPEAVPLLNFIDVGIENQPIRRVIALRDGLIILKKDGVFRIYGLTAPFTLIPLDNTVEILSDNSAVLLNNNVYFLSDQGVVAASNNGVQIVSRPIETDLLQLSTTDNFPTFPDVSFAVAYESDRKYILGMQGVGTDITCPQQYTYNYITQAWTRWTRSMNCGMVNIRDDKLYYGGPDDPTFGAYVFVERKTYTNNDYADEDYTINIVNFSGTVVTLDTTSNVAVGNTIFQSIDRQAVITQIVNPTTILVDTVITWNLGAATLFIQIQDELETIQLDAKNPGIMKHFRSISYVFSESNFDNLNITYSTDTSNTQYVQTIPNKAQAAWGFFNWGSEPWGGLVGGKKRIETKFPKGAQRCDWVTINIQSAKAFSSFGLSGFSIVYTTMSERRGGNQATR